MSDLEYTGHFKPGDRVVCLADNIDGSYEGEEGTVIKTYRQKGGTFAPERNVEIVLFDMDESEGDPTEDAGRAALVAKYDEGDLFAGNSDDFEFEEV